MYMFPFPFIPLALCSISGLSFALGLTYLFDATADCLQSLSLFLSYPLSMSLSLCLSWHIASSRNAALGVLWHFPFISSFAPQRLH